MKIELTDQVKEKLADAVELWAIDVLPGKPAILATAVFFALEKTLDLVFNSQCTSNPIYT